MEENLFEERTDLSALRESVDQLKAEIGKVWTVTAAIARGLLPARADSLPMTGHYNYLPVRGGGA